MITILSPAKTLDYDSDLHFHESSHPRFEAETSRLVKTMATFSPQDLSDLMGISDSLADLNVKRFNDFDVAPSRQALMTFNGHVYRDIDWQHYDKRDFEFAQQHLRILSGLYGLLRPLDLIKPYRLEMGTKLKTSEGSNLYEFWGDKIAQELEKDLSNQGDSTIVNLASNEYSKAVLAANLDNADSKPKVVTPIFKDWNEKSSSYRVISVYAKLARGTMTNWVIKNRVNDIDELMRFAEAGYRLDKTEETSDGIDLIFLRDEKK